MAVAVGSNKPFSQPDTVDCAMFIAKDSSFCVTPRSFLNSLIFVCIVVNIFIYYQNIRKLIDNIRNLIYNVVNVKLKELTMEEMQKGGEFANGEDLNIDVEAFMQTPYAYASMLAKKDGEEREKIRTAELDVSKMGLFFKCAIPFFICLVVFLCLIPVFASKNLDNAVGIGIGVLVAVFLITIAIYILTIKILTKDFEGKKYKTLKEFDERTSSEWVKNYDEYKEKLIEKAGQLSEKYFNVKMLKVVANSLANDFDHSGFVVGGETKKAIFIKKERIRATREGIGWGYHCYRGDRLFKDYLLPNVDNALQRLAISTAVAKLAIKIFEKKLEKNCPENLQCKISIEYEDYKEGLNSAQDIVCVLCYECRNKDFLEGQSW